LGTTGTLAARLFQQRDAVRRQIDSSSIGRAGQRIPPGPGHDNRRRRVVRVDVQGAAFDQAGDDARWCHRPALDSHLAVERADQRIDEGRLGRLHLADAYVKWFRVPEYYGPGSWHGTLALDGGGALINQAVHTVDLLRWMVGPVETVFAFKGALRYPHIEGEDTLVASLRFKSGALGVIEATTSIAPGFKRRLEISGERGTVILDGDEISVWSLEGEDGDTEAKGEQITDGSSNPAAIATEGHRRQIEDMITAVIDNREPVVSGREGRHSLEVIEALYRSANENRAVIL